jgi:hypothetical protein
MSRLHKLVTKVKVKPEPAKVAKKPALKPPAKFVTYHPEKAVRKGKVSRKIPVVKLPPKHKAPKSAFKKGADNWWAKAPRDQYGLPIPPAGIGKRGPDINKSLNLLLQDYTEAQLQSLLDRAEELGLRIGWTARIRQVLDTRSSDPIVRSRALKLIDERLYGAPKQTVENLNPLLALLDDRSKLRPR